jgi:DNA-binding XRE family transcriptional regulator
MNKKLIAADDLHAKWMKRPGYAKAYAELEPEFALADAMIAARAEAGLTQEQLAGLMDTTRTAIARLESGRQMPSTRTLERFAKATGHRLRISFELVAKQRKPAARKSA